MQSWVRAGRRYGCTVGLAVRGVSQPPRGEGNTVTHLYPIDGESIQSEQPGLVHTHLYGWAQWQRSSR